jgi:rRNA maturation RNase YbeY
VDPDSSRQARAAAGLRVTVTDGRGRSVRDGGLARWLASVAPARVSGEVAVALVSDAQIRELNRTYRRKDHATDVLSFPSSVADSFGSGRHYSMRVGPHHALSLGGAAARRFPPAPRSGRRRSPEPRTPNRERRAPSPERPLLGDIVIATGVARRQAREAGHAYHTELRVLALHGLLHLLGYDHERPDDAGRMARVETRLRRRGGLKSGLIGRAGRVERSTA